MLDLQQKEKQKSLVEEREVLTLVHAERKMLPMLGGKKLYVMISPSLQARSLKIGRDKLFTLLSKYDLLIKNKKK